MIKRFWNSIKEIFTGPSIKTQFEEMVLQEEVKKQEPVVADYTPSHGSHADPVSKVEADGTVTILAEPVHGKHSKPVNDQITDAVTAEKPKKTRKKKEESSEAPVKKPRKKKSNPEA